MVNEIFLFESCSTNYWESKKEEQNDFPWIEKGKTKKQRRTFVESLFQEHLKKCPDPLKLYPPPLSVRFFDLMTGFMSWFYGQTCPVIESGQNLVQFYMIYVLSSCPDTSGYKIPSSGQKFRTSSPGFRSHPNINNAPPFRTLAGCSRNNTFSSALQWLPQLHSTNTIISHFT